MPPCHPDAGCPGSMMKSGRTAEPMPSAKAPGTRCPTAKPSLPLSAARQRTALPHRKSPRKILAEALKRTEGGSAPPAAAKYKPAGRSYKKLMKAACCRAACFPSRQRKAAAPVRNDRAESCCFIAFAVPPSAKRPSAMPAGGLSPASQEIRVLPPRRGGAARWLYRKPRGSMRGWAVRRLEARFRQRVVQKGPSAAKSSRTARRQGFYL